MIQLKKATLIVASLYAGICLLISFGVLARLSPTGTVMKLPAIAVSTAYALLALLFLWVIHAWKSNRKNLFIVVASSVLCLLLTEIAVRIIHPHHATKAFRLLHSFELHHTMPTNETMVLETSFLPAPSSVSSGTIIVKTNEVGLRSDYPLEQFLQHETRIVILGDSFTFGLFVDQQETFPYLLERRLRKELHQEGIAVLNAGVVSYSPYLESLQLDSALKAWRPSLVLLVLDATDVGDDYVYRSRHEASGSRFLRESPFMPLLKENRLLDRFALFQRFYFPALLIKGVVMHPALMATRGLAPIPARIPIDGKEEESRFFIYRYPPEKTRPFFLETLSNIRNIAEFAAVTGAEFMLVVAPRYHHWNPRECPDNWEAGEYGLNEPYQYSYLDFFEEVRREVDFPILNLLPAFQSTKEFPLVFRDDPHWNSQGHILVAEALLEKILEEGLVQAE